MVVTSMNNITHNEVFQICTMTICFFGWLLFFFVSLGDLECSSMSLQQWKDVTESYVFVYKFLSIEQQMLVGVLSLVNMKDYIRA